MLINRTLHNTDDHLRNFSLIQYPDGWRLSPVYDVVPDFTLSSDHQLTVLGSTYLPTIESAEAIKAGQALGLTRSNTPQIIERVKTVTSNWIDILLEAGLSENELAFARKIVTDVR
jgi:serine/threonine-protein kinase HipA